MPGHEKTFWVSDHVSHKPDYTVIKDGFLIKEVEELYCLFSRVMRKHFGFPTMSDTVSQTRLYRHKRWLSDLGSRGIVLSL